MPAMQFQRFMFFPFLVFLAAFGLDKQLFIGDFPCYFLRTASFINYEHKIELINELDAYLQEPGRLRTIALFGSSRTLSFDSAYLREKHPDWVLFNFSVPGGNNDYYHRLMEEIRSRQIRPDVMIFTVTPQGFNATPAVSLDEVMLNGLPFSFVTRHADHYRLEDLTNYAIKKMFWSYRYRLNWATILKRSASGGKEMIQFKQFLSRTTVALSENRGSVPFFTDVNPREDREFFRRDAENTWSSFYRPFRPSAGQMRFATANLALAQELGVPTIQLWAPEGPELRALVDGRPLVIDGEKTTVRAYWESRMRALSERYDAPFLDLNFSDRLSCDRYYDVSHLAGVCFAEFTDRIISSANSIAPRTSANDH